MGMDKNQLEEYLIKNYPTKPKDEIINDLGLSWNYIQKKSSIFNIKREFYESKCNSQFSKILELSNIDCYWIGFLLADGHLSKRSSMDINLSIKDEGHLIKMINYYELNSKIIKDETTVRVSISDKPTMMKLSRLFNWKTNKTKNPINIPTEINNDKLFSLIIGFIDGDGSISKSGDSLRIKCDRSWKSILDIFYENLMEYNHNFNYVDNCYYISITKQEKLREIKEKSILLDLPIMERKWRRINEYKILKNEKRGVVMGLINNGKSLIDIINITGYSRSLVYKTLNEH